MNRKKFVGIEILLMSIFLIGYSIIDAIFLEDYTTVDTLLSTNEYTLYMVCMVVLIAIAGLVPFLAGTQYQTWIIKRSMTKMMDDIEKSPLNTLLTSIKQGESNNESPERNTE